MAFSSAVPVDACFAAFGKAASYTPPGGGAGVACTVLLDKCDAAAMPGDGRPLPGQVRIEVRVSEIAVPAAQGTFGPPASSVPGRDELAATYTVLDRPIVTDPDGRVRSMWAI